MEWGIKLLSDEYTDRGIRYLDWDHKEAVKWLTEAAKMDNARAQTILGKCYMVGDGSVIRSDIEKGTELLIKANQQGNLEAGQILEEYYPLGIPEGFLVNCKLTTNEDVPMPVIENGAELLTKAAEQGDISAQLKLGLSYYNGDGVEQNCQKAIYWLTKAAEQGDISAQLKLGLSYYNGDGVGRNYQKAIYWLTKAAEQGDISAQLKLGLSYYNGYGVEQNYKKAVNGLKRQQNKGMLMLSIILVYVTLTELV